MGLSSAILFAVVLDYFAGDPGDSFHPVALFGRLISRLEYVVNRENWGRVQKKIIGTFFLMALVSLSSLVVWLTIKLFTLLGAGFPMTVFWIWIVITPKSLKKAGNEVGRALQNGNLRDSRFLLSGLVSRDTKKMDADQIAKSAIESVAENSVDGVIAPLFYAAVGGPPLAVVYRVVNTLDSMIGYKDSRYLDFGWASARLDDVLNYIPARLARYILSLSAVLVTGRWRSALKVSFADGWKHPSPNSGIPEAAMAGALGVRLGGPAVYGGRMHDRQYLGDGGTPTVSDLSDAIRIMETATAITVAAAALLASIIRI